jgi:hypothetical protein
MTTNDWIEKILREDAARPLADGGFTRRVMDTLPVRQARHISWLRPALMMGSAALGGALAAAIAGTSLPQGLTHAALTGMAMVAAMVVSALVLASDV